MCYNRLSQREVCIQKEVCVWYHLLMLSEMNLEYMLRPGGLLVQEAGRLTSNITIIKGAKSGDAKRIFSVMNLAVKKNDKITVQVEGENETADAEVMKNFFKQNL